MNKILNLGLVLMMLLSSFGALRASDPAAPAANQTTHSIVLPAGHKTDEIAAALVKAFTAHHWAGATADKDTVTATIDSHEIKVTAKAVCTETEIKITTDFTPGPNKPEKARATVQRWLRNLDKNTKKELGILPQKEKKEHV
jgi:hypothetical protein